MSKRGAGTVFTVLIGISLLYALVLLELFFWNFWHDYATSQIEFFVILLIIIGFAGLILFIVTRLFGVEHRPYQTFGYIIFLVLAVSGVALIFMLMEKVATTGVWTG